MTEGKTAENRLVDFLDSLVIAERHCNQHLTGSLVNELNKALGAVYFRSDLE